MKIVYPDHLKFLKETYGGVKRDKGIKPRRKSRKNYKHKMNGQSLNLIWVSYH